MNLNLAGPKPAGGALSAAGAHVRVCGRLPIVFKLVISQRSGPCTDPNKGPRDAPEGLNGEPGPINRSLIPV